MDVKISQSINKNLSKFCAIHWLDLKMVDVEAEDFKQDIIVNILSRKGLNESRLHAEPYSYPFIFLIAQRELIERKRKKFGRKKRLYCGNPVSFISTSTPVGNKEKNMRLEDFLEADKDLSLVLVELLEMCPKERISDRTVLTWRRLLMRSLKEDAENIAQSVGVSPARVRQWQSRLCSILKAA
jgi:hypothetical protein